MAAMRIIVLLFYSNSTVLKCLYQLENIGTQCNHIDAISFQINIHLKKIVENIPHIYVEFGSNFRVFQYFCVFICFFFHVYEIVL